MYTQNDKGLIDQRSLSRDYCLKQEANNLQVRASYYYYCQCCIHKCTYKIENRMQFIIKKNNVRLPAMSKKIKTAM